MRRTAGVVFILGAMLIAAPMGHSAWSDWASTSRVWTKVENTLINAVYGGIRDFCTENLGHICGAILMHPHEFEIELRATTTTIPRQKAKAVLGVPTLNIYMSDGDRHQLSKRREIALSKGGAWAADGLTDWFNGEIATDKSQKIVKVRFRLKGKDRDHVESSKTMSLRVKVKNGDHILGMSEFSIHKPGIRQNVGGAIAQDVMKKFGVLAIGTIFAEVRINNESVGIRGLEEYFTKEMLEAQGRRDSAIIGIDDDWSYAQLRIDSESERDYSRLLTSLHNTLEWDKSAGIHLTVPLSLRDYPVQTFHSRRFSRGTNTRPPNVNAVSIFRDVIDGRLPGSMVYDYNQLARFWIIAHIFQGQHGITFFTSNRRDYFNPITRRLEPVSYDLNVNHLHPCLSDNKWVFYSHWEYPCVVSDPSVRSIWDNPRFRKTFWKEAATIRETIRSPSFVEWFTSKRNRYDAILNLDDAADSSKTVLALFLNPLSVVHLENNLSTFLSRVHDKFLRRPVAATQGDIKQQKDVVVDIVSPANQELMTHVDPLHTHIRPFVFWSLQGASIEIKNVTLDPIVVDSIFYTKNSGSSLVPIGVEIPTYTVGSTDHIFQTEVPASQFVANESLWIKYSHKSKTYTRPMIAQARGYRTGYESNQHTAAWFKTNSVHVDEKTKSIAFGPGRYSLKVSIQTRPGWQVKFRPGAVLEFKQGARLRVNGPVYLLGTKDAPVHLMVEPDASQSSKSWGGLLVVNAEEQSKMRHVLVTGSGSGRRKITQRQDANGLTGCITFYKSNLSIRNATFSGLHCEDALNIVHSKFVFDHLEISDSKADGLDSDFSHGKITNSIFRNNKNDHLDLSGSDVELRSSNFFNSGDKAISVGEGSTLEAGDIKITGATAGIVSKDQSVVNIRNATMTNVNTGLMAYIKKPGWGPPTLNCHNCSFEHVESIAVKQNQSTIIFNGNKVGTVPFSRKQLRIAGYLQSNL